MYSLVRVSVTLAVVGVLWCLRFVPLPGADLPGGDDGGLPLSMVSIGALGSAPWIAAFLVVEFGALVRERWRALRVGGAVGRARLAVPVWSAWLLTASVQSVALALQLDEYGALGPAGGWRPLAVTGLLLIAGSALFGVGARVIDAWGFGNGFAVLIGFATLQNALPGLRSVQEYVATHASAIPPVGLLLLGVGLGVRALPRLWSRDGAIPLLSAGLAPVAVSVTTPGFLAAFGPAWLGGSTMVVVAVAAAATLVYATLFHLPGNVAPVVGLSPSSAAASLGSTLPIAVVVVLVAALVVVGEVPAMPAVDVVAIAIVTAHLFDLRAEWLARAELGDVAVAAPLHRVYALPPALRALDAAGIPAAVRGLRFRQLLHFFGPYVPIEVLVPRARLAEAQVVLRGMG